MTYETFHFCCHVCDNWFVRNMPFINTIRRHHTAHHNMGIMMHFNMNLTFPIADWFLNTSDLDRGLFGHLFNGYSTEHVKAALKPAIARFAPTRRRAPAALSTARSWTPRNCGPWRRSAAASALASRRHAASRPRSGRGNGPIRLEADSRTSTGCELSHLKHLHAEPPKTGRSVVPAQGLGAIANKY